MTTISEAVVLMAGAGSRLAPSGNGGLKPLTPILQRPLVSYLFDALSAVGIQVVHAVVGYESESVVDKVSKIIPAALEVRFIENPNWRKQNGLSLLAAAGKVNSPFVITMSDHLFDAELLEIILDRARPGVLNLGIDRKIESIVDIDDAMKVRTRGSRVLSIGKDLQKYDAIDTGLFVANDELFAYLHAAKQSDDCSLADGVRSMAADGKVRAIDVGDGWWQDVDTPATLLAAETHLRSRLHNVALAAPGSSTQQQGYP